MKAMKRNKPPTQPTRVMPKRNSTRLLPETSLSSEQQGRSVRKHKRRARDTVHSKQKVVLEETNEEQSTSEVRSVNLPGRSSPDANCSICLCPIRNRAFTDSCYHTFCFECLLEWSRVRAVCPLCKKHFSSIVHDFKSYDDYQLYHLPKRGQNDTTDHAHHHQNVTPPSIAFNPVGFWVSPDNHASRVRHAERLLAFRRRIYVGELQFQGLWTSAGHVVPSGYTSPTMFACNPFLLERFRPWVIRDLHVIVNRLEVASISERVINLLCQFHITSEEFYEQLYPHLGLSTRLFLQELDSFARSPYDMATFDDIAVYDHRPAMSERIASHNVENISSSDDSDVEITRSETSEMRVEQQPDALPQHVGGLLNISAFRGNIWSLIGPGGQGLDSPTPGPSGYTYQELHDVHSSTGSTSNADNISVLFDDSISGSVTESDNMATTLSDCDSDVVVVDTNSDRHSPIMLSSDNEDDITVLTPCEAQHIHRRSHKKKRRNKSTVRHIKDSITDVETARPGSDRRISGDIVLQDEISDGSRMSLDGNHLNVQQSKSGSWSRNQLDNDSEVLTPNSRSINDLTGADDGQSNNELPGNTASQSKHKSRSKRFRQVSSHDAEDVDTELSGNKKLPACKKHISGHKSSKRKYTDSTDNVLDVCNLKTLDAGVSKSDITEDPASSASCGALDSCALYESCKISATVEGTDNIVDCVTDEKVCNATNDNITNPVSAEHVKPTAGQEICDIFPTKENPSAGISCPSRQVQLSMEGVTVGDDSSSEISAGVECFPTKNCETSVERNNLSNVNTATQCLDLSLKENTASPGLISLPGTLTGEIAGDTMHHDISSSYSDALNSAAVDYVKQWMPVSTLLSVASFDANSDSNFNHQPYIGDSKLWPSFLFEAYRPDQTRPENSSVTSDQSEAENSSVLLHNQTEADLMASTDANRPTSSSMLSPMSRDNGDMQMITTQADDNPKMPSCVEASIQVIDDSDDDDEVGVEVELSDSEVEWLPDECTPSTSAAGMKRRRRCISVSSEDSVELLNDETAMMTETPDSLQPVNNPCPAQTDAEITESQSSADDRCSPEHLKKSNCLSSLQAEFTENIGKNTLGCETVQSSVDFYSQLHDTESTIQMSSQSVTDSSGLSLSVLHNDDVSQDASSRPSFAHYANDSDYSSMPDTNYNCDTMILSENGSDTNRTKP